MAAAQDTLRLRLHLVLPSESAIGEATPPSDAPPTDAPFDLPAGECGQLAFA